MTRATSGRRVGTRKRRTKPSSGRMLGSFARSAGAVAIGFGVVAGALTAAGWIYSVAHDAREERRTTIGLPPEGKFTWLSIPTRAIAATVPYVTRNWPEEMETAEVTGSTVVPKSIALPSSGLLGEAADAPIFFSAESRHSYQFEQRFSALGDRFDNRPFFSSSTAERIVREKGQPPMILPRARRTASLPPSNGIAIPEDDQAMAKTAIYDINAKAVYLPNGEKLEAHSGLGQYMDDPRHVKLRMRGVTPPNSYRLTMREALFHGVEAIRMNPEDKAAMFGRAGILVHPYMLGPNGQSNGCVSLKDYPKFLAAFKRGEVNRMIVVFKLPEPPAAYARRNGIKSSGKGLFSFL